MMKIKLVLISVFLICNFASAQNELNLKTSIYAGGARQGATYLKFERALFSNNWTETIINIGVGSVSGEGKYGIFTMNKIMPGVAQLFGYKRFFLELGVEPSIVFYRKVAFIDLNAIVGLRYQNRASKDPSFFAQIGLNPKMYYSHNSNIDVPFYFGIGLSL